MMIRKGMNDRLANLIYVIIAALVLTFYHVLGIVKSENWDVQNKVGGNETPLELRLDGGIRFHPLDVDQIIISSHKNGREHILEIKPGKSVNNDFSVCINGSCTKMDKIVGRKVDIDLVTQNIGFKIGTGYDLKKEFCYKVILGIRMRKKDIAICDEYLQEEYGVLVLDFNLNGDLKGRYVACPQSIR